MRIIGETIIGPVHEGKGEESQDFYDFFTDGRFSVAAVADGAGSLSDSLRGAQTVVQEILEFSQKSSKSSQNLSEILDQALSSARSVVRADANAKQMGCTVSSAIVNEDDWSVLVGGDAFAVVSYSDGEHVLVRPTRKSEYANITTLITSEHFDTSALSGETKDIRAISLASDGMEFASLKDGEPLASFWDPYLSYLENPDFSIMSLFSHMKSHEKIVDDTTLLTILR
jgi:hypothetical protein